MPITPATTVNPDGGKEETDFLDYDVEDDKLLDSSDGEETPKAGAAPLDDDDDDMGDGTEPKGDCE